MPLKYSFFRSVRTQTEDIGVLLTNFNKAWILTKDAVNPKSLGNQKNKCTTVKTALTNLKRSGFVFITDNLILKNIEHKTKCRCFFDAHEIVQSLIAGLTKRFGYFGAPKYHAPRHRAITECRINCVHTIGIRENNDRSLQSVIDKWSRTS